MPQRNRAAVARLPVAHPIPAFSYHRQRTGGKRFVGFDARSTSASCQPARSRQRRVAYASAIPISAGSCRRWQKRADARQHRQPQRTGFRLAHHHHRGCAIVD